MYFDGALANLFWKNKNMYAFIYNYIYIYTIYTYNIYIYYYIILYIYIFSRFGMDISWLFFQEFGTSTCVKHVELVWQNENYHMGKETCGEKWRDDVVSLQRTPEFKHFENGWCLRRMRILVYQERGRYGQYTSSSVTNKHGFKDDKREIEYICLKILTSNDWNEDKWGI